jgi:hypothetical protein
MCNYTVTRTSEGITFASLFILETAASVIVLVSVFVKPLLVRVYKNIILGVLVIKLRIKYTYSVQY